MSNNNRKSQVVLQVLLAVVLVASLAMPGWAQNMAFSDYCQECVDVEIEGLTPAHPHAGDTVTIKFRILYEPHNQACGQELRDYNGDLGSQVLVQWSTDPGGFLGEPHYVHFPDDDDSLYLHAGETSYLLSDTVTLPQTAKSFEVEIGLEDDTMQGYTVVSGGLFRYTIGPHFTNYNATPDQGKETTEFCFRTQYICPENTAPTAVKVEIDGQLHEMQKEDASDTNYADGCWYTYTTSLPVGNHTFKYIAYSNAQVVAETPPSGYPRVYDTISPVIVGADQERPPIRIYRENKVTLTGTATDSGGVTLVQWSSDRKHWEAAQGTTQWSFTANFDVPDQAVRTKWIYVRAKDAAGHYTPESQFWKQKVVFDNRHPYVVEHFVTEDSLVGIDWDDTGIHDSRPMNLGGPTMGNPYLVCFKLKNPTGRLSEITFGWEETDLDYDEPNFTAFVEWDVNMDECTSYGPDTITLLPETTRWYWTKWNHRWQWIPDQGWSDFLIDLVVSFIPVGSEVTDAVSFCTWIQTGRAAVLEARVKVEPDYLSPNLLPPTPDPIPITIKVSIPKRISLYSSVVAGVAGMVSTNLGFACVSWNPPLGIALFAVEAASIATSHALYEAAEDPDPKYQRRVELKRIDCPEIDKLKGGEGSKMAQEAVRVTENARAFRDAYARYLGAAQAGDKEWAQIHAKDAADFAHAAANHVKTVSEGLKGPLEKFQHLSDEERQRLLAASKQGLPDIERQLLSKSFGMSPKDVNEWSRRQGECTKALLDNPKTSQVVFVSLANSLEALAKEMEKKSRQ